MANEIFIDVNNIRYSGFTSVEINKSLNTFTGSFAANFVSKELFIGDERIIENPIKLQDKVEIFIDEELKLTGFVESLDISYTSNSHSISVSGRDRTGDLVDSSIISKSYKTRNLKRLIELVLLDNGYSDIRVIQQTFNIDNLEENERVEAEPSDTIFSFIDRYAKKVQVLLTTNEDGDILLTREGQSKISTDLISLRQGQNNNIKSASISLNTTNRYRFIEMYSQSANDSFGENSINQSAIAEDQDIRSPRRLRVVNNVASQTPILQDAARWQSNLRRAKGLSYKCTVVNYLTEGDRGETWQINRNIVVKDDKCSLDGEFLISSVSFKKSLQGSITELEIVNKGSYTIDPLSLVSKDLGDDFIEAS
jgi:prophage tail gpP-like protein